MIGGQGRSTLIKSCVGCIVVGRLRKQPARRSLGVVKIEAKGVAAKAVLDAHRGLASSHLNCRQRWALTPFFSQVRVGGGSLESTLPRRFTQSRRQ